MQTYPICEFFWYVTEEPLSNSRSNDKWVCSSWREQSLQLIGHSILVLLSPPPQDSRTTPRDPPADVILSHECHNVWELSQPVVYVSPPPSTNTAQWGGINPLPTQSQHAKVQLLDIPMLPFLLTGCFNFACHWHWLSHTHGIVIVVSCSHGCHVPVVF